MRHSTKLLSLTLSLVDFLDPSSPIALATLSRSALKSVLETSKLQSQARSAWGYEENSSVSGTIERISIISVISGEMNILEPERAVSYLLEEIVHFGRTEKVPGTNVARRTQTTDHRDDNLRERRDVRRAFLVS